MAANLGDPGTREEVIWSPGYCLNQVCEMMQQEVIQVISALKVWDTRQILKKFTAKLPKHVHVPDTVFVSTFIRKKMRR